MWHAVRGVRPAFPQRENTSVNSVIGALYPMGFSAAQPTTPHTHTMAEPLCAHNTLVVSAAPRLLNGIVHVCVCMYVDVVPELWVTDRSVKRAQVLRRHRHMLRDVDTRQTEAVRGIHARRRGHHCGVDCAQLRAHTLALRQPSSHPRARHSCHPGE